VPRQSAMTASLAGLAMREALTRRTPARVPEPMVMEGEESAAAFDVAHPVLQLPIYRVSAEATSRLLPENGMLVDLGSGTGQLLAHLATARADISAVGTDLAESMLARGRSMLVATGLADRIELRLADMTSLPDDLPSDPDAVSCVWAMHHLPTRDHLVACLREIARIRHASDCAVWILDFARPRHDRTPQRLVDLAPDAPPQLRADGIASMKAGWSPDEFRAAADEAGLDDLRGGRTRPLGHLQTWWAPARNGRASAHDARWNPPPLPVHVRRLTHHFRMGVRLPA
jgi:tRNA (cmo5U34)-methyltransferase